MNTKHRNRLAVILIILAALLVATAILNNANRTMSMSAALVAIVLIVVAHGLTKKPSDAQSNSKQLGVLKRKA